MCLLPSALQTASSHFRSRTSPCKAATVPWGTLSRHLPAPSLSPLRSRQRGAAERRGAASRRARSPARPCPRPHSPRTSPAAASSHSISARRPIPGARQQPEPGASVAAADLSPPGPLLRPRGALPAMSAPAEPGAARCRGTAAGAAPGAAGGGNAASLRKRLHGAHNNRNGVSAPFPHTTVLKAGLCAPHRSALLLLALTVLVFYSPLSIAMVLSTLSSCPCPEKLLAKFTPTPQPEHCST